jgi:hypothetical protein
VSLKNHPQLRRRTKKTQFQNVEQIKAFATAIKNKIGDWGQIGAVVLDEASGMAKQDLDGVVKSRALVDASKDPNEAKWPDMGASNNRMIGMYNGLIQIGGVHIISTAHVRMEKDDTGFERQSPDFMPQLGKQVRQLMHLVAFVAMEEQTDEGVVKEVRTFQVHPSMRIVAKSRVGSLGRKVLFRDLASGLAEWLGNGGKSAEPTRLVFDDSGSVDPERSAE